MRPSTIAAVAVAGFVTWKFLIPIVGHELGKWAARGALDGTSESFFDDPLGTLEKIGRFL